MKKIFTLLASALMAITVSAQNSVPAVTITPATPAGGETPTLVYAWMSTDGTVVEQGGKATHKNAPESEKDRVNYAHGDYYTICLNGKKGSFGGDVSNDACYIEIALDNALTSDGTLTITGYISKDQDKTANAYLVYYDADGNKISDFSETENYPNLEMGATAPGSHSVTVPSGTKTIAMTRNSTGTNLFIVRLSLLGTTAGGSTPTPSEPDPVVPAEDEVEFTVEGYSTLQGQSFGTYKGSFNFDVNAGKLTLKDFLGSTTTVEFDVKQADATADPVAKGTKYNLTPTAGLTGSMMCTIDNYTDGSFIAQKDGVNFIKLNPGLMVLTGDYYSSMTVKNIGTDEAPEMAYQFMILIYGKTNLWNTETNEWYTARYVTGKGWEAGTAANSYLQLIVNVPVEAAGEEPTEPEPVEGETFEVYDEMMLYGQNVGTLVTPFAMDFTAQTLNFNNFLGSGTDVKFNYVERSSAVPAETFGKMYNLDPASGLTDSGESLYGDVIYDVAGLEGKVLAFDKVKYNTPRIITGTYSSVEYASKNTWKVILYMTCKSFELYDETTSAWNKKDMAGYFQIELTVTEGNSGIADVFVDDADENAPVEYYNLQGIRINEPAQGQVVIRRQGNKVSKIVVR